MRLCAPVKAFVRLCAPVCALHFYNVIKFVLSKLVTKKKAQKHE